MQLFVNILFRKGIQLTRVLHGAADAACDAAVEAEAACGAAVEAETEAGSSWTFWTG